METECWFGVDPLPSSVAELVHDADLIIRGRIVDLYIGEYWHGALAGPLAYAKVAIDELLFGESIARFPGFVEVQIGHAPDDIDELRMILPAHDHLWFLNYEDPETRGQQNQSQEIVGFVYYAGQDIEKVFREIDGVVEILAPAAIKETYGRDEFLLSLDGTSFEEFVQRVRDELRRSVRVPAVARTSNNADPQIKRYAAC